MGKTDFQIAMGLIMADKFHRGRILQDPKKWSDDRVAAGLEGLSNKEVEFLKTNKEALEKFAGEMNVEYDKDGGGKSR
jgi:hypothetical protein